jgi:hypothetical protein
MRTRKIYFAAAFERAPLAAALGPEVAVGEPSGGYVGHLEILPTHGPVGTPATVTAERTARGLGIPARLAHGQRSVEGRGRPISRP